MTVLAGMPVPVRPCPAANPVTLVIPVMVGLPLVVMPVNETGEERTCPTARLALLVMVTAVLTVAVAFADIVIVVPLIALMAVLAGMPAPVRTCPIANPVRLDTLVSVGLPEVVMAVNEALIDTFVREALALVVMAVNEIVGPAMTCPTVTPARLVTFVMTLLPAVTVPVGVTMLLAMAGKDIWTVLAPTNVMSAPGAMPGAVRGWLADNPNPAVPGTPEALVT
jgi:hypothetical protein